jgi:hypothetical protein
MARWKRHHHVQSRQCLKGKMLCQPAALRLHDREIGQSQQNYRAAQDCAAVEQMHNPVTSKAG